MATFLRRGTLLLLAATALLALPTATVVAHQPQHAVVADHDTSWGDQYKPKPTFY
ncbi:hypothetical protein ACFW1A_04570 [Kitasatospora sp. NPDC058965]|uniref:hypothetical protein n=1 Tax=Kitasatospora sp. NPDC058965 TaxID=3346682 RepID=UPI003686FCB4